MLYDLDKPVNEVVQAYQENIFSIFIWVMLFLSFICAQPEF